MLHTYGDLLPSRHLPESMWYGARPAHQGTVIFTKKLFKDGGGIIMCRFVCKS